MLKEEKMRFIVSALAALFITASPLSAAELAPPTISGDSSSYIVTFHVETGEDAVNDNFHDQAKAARDKLGDDTTVSVISVPRKGGGLDITYTFKKKPLRL